MNKKKLVASAKKGTHEVKIYHKGYVKKYVYGRIRKETFPDQPSPKAFMSAIFRLAHDVLRRNAQIK